MSGDGTVKIADMELSKILTNTIYDDRVAGVRPYMSPEALKNLKVTQEYSFRADIWYSARLLNSFNH